MTNCEIIEQEIAELEAKQIDYSTAEKLAWLYIVRDHIKHAKTQTMEVYEAPEPVKSMERSVSKPEIVLSASSGSEFMQTIEGKDLDCVLMIIDETMNTIQTTLPRIYNNTMAQLRDI